MSRVRVLSVLVVAATGLCGLVLLRHSGLASRPAQALAALPHGQWFVPGSAPEGAFEAPLEGGKVKWVGTYGNVVDNMIFHFGLYERGECHLARELLEEAGGGFLDVGANFGNHSFYLAPYATEVHAIEPWPPALERMRAIQAANPGVKVNIHPVGYANEPGTLPFYPPPEGSFVVGSFDPDFADAHAEPQLLPLVVADEHLRSVGAGELGLVKCDIEGYERFALEGMAETLRRDRPIVMFELNLTDGGFRSMDQLTATFPEDYSFFEIDTDPEWMIPLGRAAWYYGSEATGRYHLRPLGELRRLNALAVPKEHRAFVETLAE